MESKRRGCRNVALVNFAKLDAQEIDQVDLAGQKPNTINPDLVK